MAQPLSKASRFEINFLVKYDKSAGVGTVVALMISRNRRPAVSILHSRGIGVIADNIIPNLQSCAWGNTPELYFTVMNLRRNAGPFPCWKTYPAPRQIGQGHNGVNFVTDPVYIWGNTGGGNYNNPGIGDYQPNECGSEAPTSSSFFQQDRDFFVNTPKPGYTKYTYPHPLRSSGSATPTPSPIPSPSLQPGAPTNLRSLP